jgi:hypothetical protein
MITSGCVYKFYDLRRWYFQHIIFKINTYDDHDALEGVKAANRSKPSCPTTNAVVPLTFSATSTSRSAWW